MEKAFEPSIIEHFRIEGLFGYRTISLDATRHASILIAQNGSGKTTLMSVLNSVLTKSFGRLRHLQFDRLVLKLREIDEISVSSESFHHLTRMHESEKIQSYAQAVGVNSEVLAVFLLDEFPGLSDEDLIEHPTFNKITPSLGYSYRKTQRQLQDMYEAMFHELPELSQLLISINSALSEYEVLYLPTYRRLELSLASDKSRRRRNQRPSLKLDEETIHSGKVEFGLSDIQAQLRSLNDEISHKSNTGYRDLTARVLNDLLENKLDDHLPLAMRKPSKDDLEIFFERLQDSRRIGPYSSVTIPNLEKLYETSTDDSRSNVFLEYFLDQLTDVIETTRHIEQSVDQFVSTCNRYLGRLDQLEGYGSDFYEHDFADDSKNLHLNRSTLSVSVRMTSTQRPIPLDALSSGEKQMVSMFAKMYLYPKKKLVLIDEPELSLSIDWQRSLLPDIISSPNCAQLIAITHSPFVFDNELEPLASSLGLWIDQDKIPDFEPLDSFDFD